MRLRPATIAQLARCVCGDRPLPFPYRTGKDLSEFFKGLGFDYRSEGSRNPSAHNMLNVLNLASPEIGELPSAEMKSVIEELMNRIYYEDNTQDDVNYKEALSRINSILVDYNLEIMPDSIGNVSKLQVVDGHYVSSAVTRHEAVRKITFCPSVFKVPFAEVSNDLVVVMMPFAAHFNPVYNSIKEACKLAKLRCQRVDDVWNDTTIIQDIFNLIFTSTIVVVDFTEKNANVMYETGIAHTLGKHVVPVTQSIEDVPFDLKQHRVLKYLPNNEGLATFQTTLSKRLLTIIDQDNLLRQRP